MAEKSKTGECEGCTVKRRLTMFEVRFYLSEPGGTLKETWLCTSCSQVQGLHGLMMGGYEGKLLLMVNSKLDLLLKKGAR